MRRPMKEVTQMEWAYQSDVGRVRSHNEDSVFIHQPDERMMAVIVADGMGGHRAGDVASQLAAEVVGEQLREMKIELSMTELESMLRKSVKKANDRILQRSREDKALAGMGTTLVAAIIKEEELIIGNIGDSRAYLINKKRFAQLTRDHSLVNELLHLGEITEVEAETHPQKHVLVRAVGTDPEVKPDVIKRKWMTDDHLLLCTDGLTNMVSDEQIHAVIQEDQSVKWKVDELMRRALEAGGEDNISLALVKRTVTSESPPQSDQEERGL